MQKSAIFRVSHTVQTKVLVDQNLCIKPDTLNIRESGGQP